MLKKILVICVIFLFLGVGIHPAFAGERSNEFVEITTEIYRQDRVTPHTVYLTREDAEKVKELMEDFQEKLNKIELEDEVFELFNETIIELDKYGLIGGLSVTQAQKLSTDELPEINIPKSFGGSTEKSDYSGWYNTNCKVYGAIHHVLFFGPHLGIPYVFLLDHPILYDIINFILEYSYFGPIRALLLFAAAGSILFTTLYNPLLIFSVIMVGWCYTWGPYSSGPLWISGDNGTQNFSEDYGGLISGFTGFKIYIPWGYPCFFIGVARRSLILQLEE